MKKLTEQELSTRSPWMAALMGENVTLVEYNHELGEIMLVDAETMELTLLKETQQPLAVLEDSGYVLINGTYLVPDRFKPQLPDAWFKDGGEPDTVTII